MGRFWRMESTRVSGFLRRNEGTSGEPLRCTSTGKLEETFRMRIERHLSAAP